MRISFIGAGISELYIGCLLSKYNIDFEIFQASNKNEGRISTWYYNSNN